MKRFFWLFASTLLVANLFLQTGCGEDTSTGPTAVAPLVTISNATTLVSTPSGEVTFDVTVNKGDAALNSLTISEDGTTLSTDRITSYVIDGANVDVNNPLALAAFADGFVLTVTMTAQDLFDARSISVEARDADGLTDADAFDLTVQADPPLVLVTDAPTDASANQNVNVTLDVTKGNFALASVTIQQDGADILDASRITFDASGVTANPFTLEGADKDGFSKTLGIKMPQDLADFTFTVIVTDEEGLTDESSFTIKVDGTPLNDTFSGVLLNQAGPAGQGALDLDTGTSTGVTTGNPEISEIRDMGIDQSLPNADNWRQRMGPMVVNGVEMREVDLTQVEGFDFDNVTTLEQIAGAFDTGLALTGDVDGNTATEVISIGDLYVVRRGSKDYLIRIDAINVTADDNADNYEISIKH